METCWQGGIVKDDEENKETHGRPDSPQPPMANGSHDGGRGEGTGGSMLRGCGVALGIAALIFLFIVGACFMSFG
jgi:hypothetical protein